MHGKDSFPQQRMIGPASYVHTRGVLLGVSPLGTVPFRACPELVSALLLHPFDATYCY